MVRTPVEGVCVFGGFARGYPRSEVIMRGLSKLGVRVITCQAPPKQKLFRRYSALSKAYRRLAEPFDIMLVPEFRHKDVPLARLLANRSGKRLVFDPLVSRYDTKIFDRGDAGAKSFQAWHNRNIDRWSLRLPDIVLADTKAHADYYTTELHAPPEKVHVLRVGYDDALFSPAKIKQTEEDNSRVKVLFYGSYVPLHGADTIVRAAALLRENERVEFELVGDGQTFGRVREFVAESKLENVTLSARTSVEDLRDRIARADICLGIFGDTAKASRVIPNKVYQCMGMEKPVVTAETPAIGEVFTHGKDVVLVPAADPDALAGQLERLSLDVDGRREIARRGHETVKAYTAEKIAMRFLEICGAK